MLQMRPATGPGMHRNTRRLVDDEHQPVAIQDAILQARYEMSAAVMLAIPASGAAFGGAPGPV
jgi:hypothetical protein